jgi:hypothetical protein
VSLAAWRSRESSMFRVVLICMNMHYPSSPVNAIPLAYGPAVLISEPWPPTPAC